MKNDHLSPETVKFMKLLEKKYTFSASEEKLLLTALESWDRCVQARQEIAKSGAYYSDRFGAPRPHPALKIEDLAKNTFARLMKQLKLENESPARGGE